MVADGQLRIGTSGYQYAHWKGAFYPEALPKKRWFEHYTQHFDSVEINNTFYKLPTPETFDQWREAAPDNFEYSLKFSRYGSHIKRLKDPECTIGQFTQLADRLRPALGPILVQLPPKWKARPERLEAFLDVAGQHHRWLFEFRDPSWLNEEVFSLLRLYAAGLCIHDLLTEHPHELTTDWTCLRYHGNQYGGSYSNSFLSAEADRIAQWLASGIDVYAFFNNDADGQAPRDALALKSYVQQRLTPSTA